MSIASIEYPSLAVYCPPPSLLTSSKLVLTICRLTCGGVIIERLVSFACCRSETDAMLGRSSMLVSFGLMGMAGKLLSLYHLTTCRSGGRGREVRILMLGL